MIGPDFQIALAIFGLTYYMPFVRNEWIEISQSPIKYSKPETTLPAESNKPQFSSSFNESEKLEKFNKTENNQGEMDEEEAHHETVNSEDAETFVPFLKTVQNALMKNTHKTVKSKLRVLRDLRDNLLMDIEDRMDILWPPPNNDRRAREYSDHQDSHMDFPSNEGALTTIGFLTFAVFLIKLVLKLIHALKNKNNSNGTTITTMGSLLNRKSRSTINEEVVKVMNSIDQFNYN